MNARGYDAVERGGWTLFTHREALAGSTARDCALELALGATRGQALRRVRPSRHGEKRLGRLGDAGPDAFIKVLAPVRGTEGVKGAHPGHPGEAAAE